MNPEEALKTGDLDTALSALTERVRKSPADARLRVFLFQLLTVLGQWERALSQLNIAGELDAGTLAMVSTYRDVLSCEVLRASVFSGERDPLVLGEPQGWIALLFQALRLAAEGQVAQSQELREQAFEDAPASSGRIDEEPFHWIADADGRIGPTLEAIINGRYYWVPFSQIQTLKMEAPEDLRDLVWTPAHLTLANGGETIALIPARYPGSESNPDSRIRLARLTQWIDQGAGLFTGLGQRMLTTDTGDYPLLGVQHIELDTALEPRH